MVVPLLARIPLSFHYWRAFYFTSQDPSRTFTKSTRNKYNHYQTDGCFSSLLYINAPRQLCCQFLVDVIKVRPQAISSLWTNNLCCRSSSSTCARSVADISEHGLRTFTVVSAPDELILGDSFLVTKLFRLCILSFVFFCFWYHQFFPSRFSFLNHQLCLYAPKIVAAVDISNYLPAFGARPCYYYGNVTWPFGEKPFISSLKLCKVRVSHSR